MAQVLHEQVSHPRPSWRTSETPRSFQITPLFLQSSQDSIRWVIEKPEVSASPSSTNLIGSNGCQPMSPVPQINHFLPLRLDRKGRSGLAEGYLRPKTWRPDWEVQDTGPSFGITQNGVSTQSAGKRPRQQCSRNLDRFSPQV